MSLQPFGSPARRALAGCVFHLPWWPFVIAIGDMFSSLLFNQHTRRFWSGRNHGRKPAVVAEVSTPSRHTNPAARTVGILLFPVSVGLIAAAIIGVFLGIGFWMLESPAREPITASDRGPWRPNGDGPKVGKAVLGETETPHSAAVNVIPDAPFGQRPAAGEAASSQQNNVMQELSPAPTNGEPPVETASVAQPVISAAVSPAYLMTLPSSPAVAAPDGALSAGTEGPSAHDGRSAHGGTVSRHSRPRSARAAPTLRPPRSLLAQTRTPTQTGSSGQTHTHGQTKPAGQALTPPRADQPDPFAQRVWNK